MGTIQNLNILNGLFNDMKVFIGLLRDGMRSVLNFQYLIMFVVLLILNRMRNEYAGVIGRWRRRRPDQSVRPPTGRAAVLR